MTWKRNLSQPADRRTAAKQEQNVVRRYQNLLFQRGGYREVGIELECDEVDRRMEVDDIINRNRKEYTDEQQRAQ